MQHGSRLPAANTPYSNSHPGKPTGRWSDGLLNIDYGAQGLDFQEIIAFLSENSSSAIAIMFAVSRSPVLDRSFFPSRGIRIPSYIVSLSVQMSWFKKYLNVICSTPTERENKVSKAPFLFGDVEANDITYSLIQKKSIQKVWSYISHVTKAQINIAGEVIKMGATRVILPGIAPIGCYPFILTELASASPADYYNMGCLKSVNDLIQLKIMISNNPSAVFKRKFPKCKNYQGALQSCCGIRGKYNYDKKRFCGSRGVPVCSDPNQYFFWDGIHPTQEANNRLSTTLRQATLATLNCTTS